jgi:hypothetical protein
MDIPFELVSLSQGEEFGEDPMGEQGKQSEKQSKTPHREKKPAAPEWGEATIQPAIRPQVDQILYLQRTVGNRAVTKWLESPGDRMEIGQPGVRYQQGPAPGSIQLVPEQGEGTGGES